MASLMPWKVYDPDGSHIASCVHAIDAATIVAGYGRGGMIKAHHGRPPLWREGYEEFPASGNLERVVHVLNKRRRQA